MAKRVDDAEAKNMIERAVMLINMRKCAEARVLLDEVLESNPNEASALVARGTSHALEGTFQRADLDLTKALRANPMLIDARRRRAQVRAAMGAAYIDATLEDMDTVCKEFPSIDGFKELAMYAGSMRLYKRAQAAFEKCIELGDRDPKTFSQLGVVICSQGDVEPALEKYHKALEANPDDPMYLLQIAQANKEGANFGMHLEAEKYFERLFATGKAPGLAYKLFGQMLQGCGQHARAVEVLDRGIAKAGDIAASEEDAAQVLEMRYWKASCLHAVGNHREAVEWYDAAIRSAGDNVSEDGGPHGNLRHKSFYGRELALLAAHRWNAPWDEFCVDREVTEMFKEGWCKTSPSTFVSSAPDFVAQRPIDDAPVRSPFNRVEAERLLRAGLLFGRRVHLRCQGFLPNQRQWKMACFANLEVAQAVRACVEARRAGREPPRVKTRGSTTTGPKAGGAGTHAFGWRDALDVLVKWRQLSEPNDPVVWVDMLPRPLFEMGYGSHTPMVSGETKVARYYMACAESAKVMREVLLTSRTYYDGASNRFDATPEQIEAVRAADPPTPQSLWDAVDVLSRGFNNFYIIVPLKSHARPGHQLEGTRLVLNLIPDETGRSKPTLEFSIRTPCMPVRAKDYDVEFALLWERMIAAAAEDELGEAADLALRMAHFWYNWLFISRGNAIVGLSVMLGFLCGLGLPVRGFVPEHTQPDWIAMWSFDSDDYVRRVCGFTLAAHATKDGFAQDRAGALAKARRALAWLDGLPRVADVLPTVGSRIDAMNLAWPDAEASTDPPGLGDA